MTLSASGASVQRYSSRRGALHEGFLAQVLPDASRYDRIAGYFSSSLLEVAGEMIESVRGRVRVVCNSDLQPRDVETARAANAAMRHEWCASKPERHTATEQGRTRFQRLYDLLASGKLEVRVLPNAVFGLIHGKAGVIWPAEGDPVAFIGSANETGQGWAQNYELVWSHRDADAVAWVTEEFEALWNHPQAVPLAEFVCEDAARLARRSVIAKVDAWKEQPQAAPVAIELPVYRQENGLWEHQKQFVQLAFDAHRTQGGARFVLADQVGLGKTVQLALASMLMALQGDGPVLVLPPKTLLAQWQDEMWSLLRLPSARWTNQGWIDEHGHLHPSSGPEDVARCPRRVGLVSQGLVTSRSGVVDHLLRVRYECVVVDEAHRARRRNLAANRQHERPDPNNLMRFILDIGERTKSLLLATATPVQLLPVEAFDLLTLLATGHEGVLGNRFSRWRQVEEALALTLGRMEVPNDGVSLWEYVRNPLPPASEDRTFAKLRTTLDLAADQFIASPEDHGRLRAPERQSLRQMSEGYGRLHNPFLRHIVRRTREYLESTIDPETHEPYLRPVRVELLGEDDTSALMLPLYLQEAYETAEEFCRVLGGRVKGAGFLKTLLLRRVGSSIRAGEITARKMLDSWESVLDDSDEDDDEPESMLDMSTTTRGRGAPEGPSEFRSLTKVERGLLERFLEQLQSNVERDPKVERVLQCLTAREWLSRGCIVFSQYYDSVQWLAGALSAELPEEPVAIYAGGDRSGVMRGGVFERASRDDLKRAVQRAEIRLLLGTDAASEGLNLQRLGTLINLDLPWNPTRLEQRKGRIQRIGQVRDVVQIYNMRYRGSVEDRVHQLLSQRLQGVYHLFGQLPDVLEDVWVDVALGEKAQAEKRLDETPKEHPFDLKYRKVEKTPWETCSQVLSASAMEEDLRRGWRG